MPKRIEPKSLRTYPFEMPNGTITTPHHRLIPLGIEDLYLVSGADGAGGVQLTTQVAGTHDIAGRHAVAMVANDAIRSGPLAENMPRILSNIIDLRKDERQNPESSLILKGINAATRETGIIVPSGEIAQLGNIIQGAIENPYNINCAFTGFIHKKDIITHANIKPGQVIIGISSSGMHSNGWTAAHEILGISHPSLIKEAKIATRLYSPGVEAVMKEFPGAITGTEHVTGNAYLKLEKLISFRNGRIGFHLDSFNPQGIFQEIHKGAQGTKHPLRDVKEMFRRFNMGWGFLLITKANAKQGILDALERKGLKAKEIGRVTNTGKIKITYNGNQFDLTRGTTSQ